MPVTWTLIFRIHSKTACVHTIGFFLAFCAGLPTVQEIILISILTNILLGLYVFDVQFAHDAGYAAHILPVTHW